MKKSKLFALALLAGTVLASPTAQAASCFWFGGTGNINDTSKWFAATNGGGGACAAAGGWPNSASDNATFDGNSGGGTITRNVNWSISTLNVSAFTGTFGNSGDTASVDVLTWTNSGSGVRTVNLGASTWTVGAAGGAGTGWNQNGATNLTFDPNTSTVRTVGVNANAAVGLNLGSFSYNVVTIKASAVGGGIQANMANPTIATLNIAAPNYIFINNGNNITVTGSLNFSGGGANAWTGFATTAPNNSATFTLSGGPATCDYCSFRDITAVTNAITATNSINYGRATNISITPPSFSGGSGGNSIIGVQ